MDMIAGWVVLEREPTNNGQARAIEMILTGDPLSANRALEIGLLNAVSDDPVAAACELAARVIRHSAAAVDAAKQAVYEGERKGIVQGLKHEAFLVGRCCESPEQREAVQQFLNRRRSN
jgi:enoyl-CoA hydratase/carnithine racemase